MHDLPQIEKQAIIQKKISDKTVFTRDDYDLLPEGAPYQLIGGKLIMTPAPLLKHQIVSINLEHSLFLWLKKNKAGLALYAPVDVELDDKNIVQPDLIVIKRENYKIMTEKRIVGAPDLIVEILSPDNAYNDLKRKFYLYEKYLVPEYWIIDPEFETVDIYVNENGKYILNQHFQKNGIAKSIALNGFEVEISEIFLMD